MHALPLPVSNDPVLSASDKATIDACARAYPNEQRSAALLSALHQLVAETGYLSPEKCAAVADYLQASRAQVAALVSFDPVLLDAIRAPARYRIKLCTYAHCQLHGAGEWLKQWQAQPVPTVTQEASTKPLLKWRIDTEPYCLGACGTTPAVTINGAYYSLASADDLAVLLARLS